MKQQLWIINSSLLLIFAAAILLNHFLEEPAPTFHIKKAFVEEQEIGKTGVPENTEIIYTQDLFGTFVSETPAAPAAKSLVAPVPQMPTITTPPMAEPQKPSFIPPLSVDLKGIVYSFDDEKSVVMISDETKKEILCHVGDKLKDAQLIKVARDKLVFLRTNGQHETFFLRKEDNKLDMTPEKRWEDIVQKVDEQNYNIDIRFVPEKIDSLGHLVEMLAPTNVFSSGTPIGLKLGFNDPKGIGPAIGLQKDDVLISINGTSLAEAKNRIAVYDKLTASKKDDVVKLAFKRNDKDMTISYKLIHFEKPKNRVFMPTTGEKKESEATREQPADLKLSELQEREKRLREFNKRHEGSQQDTIEEIRKRLLDNMKNRSRETRVR